MAYRIFLFTLLSVAILGCQSATKPGDSSTPGVNPQVAAAALQVELTKMIEEGDQEPLLKLLADHPGAVNGRNSNDFSPLHLAAHYGRIDIMNTLLDKGAEIEAPATFQNTPYITAAAGGQVEAAQLLVERGAKTDSLNSMGQAPLHLAALHGHAEMVTYLLEQGADVNQLDDTNSTALHWAATRNQIEVAEILLEAGALKSALDSSGRQPWLIAEKQGFQELADKLKPDEG